MFPMANEMASTGSESEYSGRGDAIIASFMGGWADGAMVFEMYGNDGYNPTPYWYFWCEAITRMNSVETSNLLCQ